MFAKTLYFNQDSLFTHSN